MLRKISIKNYAIIDRLEIDFYERMNIITGETGAGKSILLGALSLILGDRADTKVLYDKDEKCVVEAEFQIKPALKKFFEQHELDFEKHTLIRREINQSGKSRAFINDTPVTLNIVQQLGEKLVNLHSQHETLELVKSGFQLEVIDLLAKNTNLLAEYKSGFIQYKADNKKLNELVEKQRTVSAELDYLQFQWKELSEANLVKDEQESLETEQNTLSNVEEIKRSLQTLLQLAEGGEGSVTESISEMLTQIKSVKHFNKDILAQSERLENIYQEIKDITREFENIQDSTTLDPERLDEVNSRLNTIFKLQKKHNVNTISELLAIEENYKAQITSVDNSTAEIEQLQQQLTLKFNALIKVAEQLHAAREKVLREFQNAMVVLLTKVGMPNASFKVDIKKLDNTQLNENGLTEIKFLFSANKGFTPHEIKDVASGGELSRVMLCIKSLVADAAELPTMIFDEIDSGISGEVALKVGEIMKKLSRTHQIICITHLPQIARTGDTHYYIYKENSGERTNTRIKELKADERIREIAKMLSGDKVSDAALANARELIGMT
jgi:DNA repair protein RecN (Recombination protein N)